jgi:hypothetical protein
MRDLTMMDVRRGSRVRWFSRVGRLHVVHDPMAPWTEAAPPLEYQAGGGGSTANRENKDQDFGEAGRTGARS